MPIPHAESRRHLERQSKLWNKSGDAPPAHDGWRPQTRADCAAASRPCPFVGCKHHLFLDVGREGSIKYNFGEDVAVLEKMTDTCSLDVARQGGIQLEQIGRKLNVTRERARQQEADAMLKLRKTDTCVVPEDVTIQEHGYS